MNIALVCTEKLPVPPIAGGAVQLYIDGIVPYLSKEHNITVFGIEHPDLPGEEVKGNVKFVRLPANSKMKYINGVKERLSEGFDWVHVFNRPLWVLSLSEGIPQTKFSLSLHNEMFHAEKISQEEARECIDRVEFMNTVSKFIADGIEKLHPTAKDKLNVVYSGVDTSLYKPGWTEEGLSIKDNLKEKYNIKDYKVVLYVGRLSEKKGVHILLKAMKKIMEQDPKVALVIVGSKWYGKNEQDDYTRALKNFSKGLNGPVILTGFLPPSEIPMYYNLGDVFVCASQWEEPLARVHYEAMAAGLPIITTNRGGNAEVIVEGQNGFAINVYNDPNAFEEKITYLLNNPSEAQEIGKEGRRLAEDIYNWERVAKEAFKNLKGD
ncbi:MAG: glycosyltransferase family 4 protein [Clostridia bacterium]|nr:glycosyltransferase family 4 protein [Clostridia bacterium]